MKNKNMVKRKKKNASKKITKEEKAKRARELAFRRKIRNTFTDMGFVYLPSANKHFRIGNRVVELVYIFIYEKIILICEDTCGAKKDMDHIRKKSEAFHEIQTNMEDFMLWLKTTFSDKESIVTKYRKERIILKYIYLSQFKFELTDDDKERYNNIIFWEPETLSYFSKMSQCIQYSARYEIFRFLELKNDQIGMACSEGKKTVISAPIIYPEDTTGIKNGVRIVSFMMSAENLIKTGYVLRKDNWEESIFLYQRLIEKDKIKKIRAFLAQKGETFYNNIIVALPDNVKFEDDSEKVVSIDEVGDFQHCKLILPDEINSIAIIDGQHRIYAHYEAPETEKYELQIAPLRKQLHLLVTGLVFPKDMKEAERKRIQSEIFLNINDNTKKVAANVLLHITMLQDPFSDMGLARRVIEKLNKMNTFLNRFELSELDENKIKVASIVKFALRYLVTVTPTEGRVSLYNYWNGDKEALINQEENALDAYVKFCAQNLNMYFSAVKNAFRDEWRNPESKLLSVISINGFIMAYNRQLRKNGLREYDFYQNSFGKMQMDFSKEGFPYTSSQYRMFSNKILMEAFGFSQEEIQNC